MTPLPRIEGPITAGKGAFMGAAVLDDRLGYSSNEYFLTGTADSYDRDGAGDVKAVDAADYRTRILVYRPVDAARFNGTVIVEWLNVSGGLDGSPDWTFLKRELMRNGYLLFMSQSSSSL